jgi:hypothetical protein
MSDSDDVVSGDSSVGEGWQEQQQYLVNKKFVNLLKCLLKRNFNLNSLSIF